MQAAKCTNPHITKEHPRRTLSFSNSSQTVLPSFTAAGRAYPLGGGKADARQGVAVCKGEAGACGLRRRSRRQPQPEYSSSAHFHPCCQFFRRQSPNLI